MVAIFLAVAFKAFAICGIGMKISALRFLICISGNTSLDCFYYNNDNSGKS